MPLPSSINDLSTTPASNSPAGSESPTLTDDYLRYYASYIAALRDVVLSGTASLTTLNLAYTGTLTGGTGVVNIGSGQIYKDASGNVGFGTSSPASILHASGASAQANIIASTGNAAFRLGDSVAGATRKEFTITLDNTNNRVDIQAIQQGVASRDISINASGGNVGIGTASPSGIGLLAAVKNAAGVTVVGVSNSNSAASDGAKLSTLFGTTQIGAYGHYWTGSAFVNDLNFYSTLTLSMGATERMRIDSSGNVGIGTAAPGRKLHVAGEVRLDATTSTSATAGANGDVPAQVVGYITINIGGTDRKIPYYAV
jgi:hypothetical protein